MIEYRRAVVEEADLIAKMRVDFLCEVNQLTEEDKQLIYKANKQYFTEALADGSFVSWFAVQDEEIAGTSGITFYKIPPTKSCLIGKAAYISNMYTYPKYRNQGIATRLFSLIVDEAKMHGRSKVMLNATDMGRPLYEKYGFKDIHGDMVYYIE